VCFRQRIQDRLEYEELEFEKVKHQNARIIVLTEDYKAVARAVSEIPGLLRVLQQLLPGRI